MPTAPARRRRRRAGSGPADGARRRLQARPRPSDRCAPSRLAIAAGFGRPVRLRARALDGAVDAVGFGAVLGSMLRRRRCIAAESGSTSRFGVVRPPGGLGAVFAARTASARVVAVGGPDRARIGLINTMVFTHLPSNVCSSCPADADLPLAVAVLLRVQPEPDGRADAPVVRDGGRRPGRAIGGGRRDRDRADDRRGDLAVVLGRARVERRSSPRSPFVPRRRPQDRLRPAAVPRTFRTRAAARRSGARAVRPAGRPDVRGAGAGPGIPSRHQTNSTTPARRRRPRSARSNGWSAWRMSTQFAPSTRARVDEQHRPEEGAGGRVDDELAERHPGHAGREADERPDDRQQPADEDGRRAVLGEEPVGQLDLVRPDQQVLAVALEERPAAVRPDGVGDERAERVPDRRHDRPRSRSSRAGR